MRLTALPFILLQATASGAQRPTPPITIPLIGEWELNPGRTHYGPGVDRRRSERFSCTGDGRRVRCVIRSVRANGANVTGRFTATVDGGGSLVTGIPDIDEVQLRLTTSALLDATFLLRGKPVFGYRALRSDDGRSLVIISVDPVSRAVLTTVVVYDRR